MGRTLHFTMSDKRSVEKFVKKVLSGLMLIDKSSHKGIHNMWILQSMLIPLPIYKISISVVTFWEHKVSSYLRKCLKIHHSATNISLYSWTSFYHLPLKSLTSILNSTKVSRHLLLRESTAEKFVSLLLSWNVDFGMSQRQILMLKVDLNFQKLLDTIKHPELALDHSKAHLFLVGTLTSIEDLFLTCSKVNENSYQAKCVQLHWQGYWTKWCDFVKNDLSWKTLLAMPFSLISFCLGATFDTLPSHSN